MNDKPKVEVKIVNKWYKVKNYMSHNNGWYSVELFDGTVALVSEAQKEIRFRVKK